MSSIKHIFPSFHKLLILKRNGKLIKEEKNTNTFSKKLMEKKKLLLTIVIALIMIYKS